MDRFDNTMQFSMEKENGTIANEIIMNVFEAMKEKGYDPINQIVGYILSEDPTYITSKGNARSIITKIDRDELLKILLEEYLSG